MSNVRPPLLPPRIANFLNAGETVAVEVSALASDENRTFVRIRSIAKPGIPREEQRYLNSTWSMWEYWDFEFRRMVLRPGWEEDEWNYDRYLIGDQRVTTYDAVTFEAALQQWVPDSSLLKHGSESECPD